MVLSGQAPVTTSLTLRSPSLRNLSACDCDPGRFEMVSSPADLFCPNDLRRNYRQVRIGCGQATVRPFDCLAVLSRAISVPGVDVNDTKKS